MYGPPTERNFWASSWAVKTRGTQNDKGAALLRRARLGSHLEREGWSGYFTRLRRGRMTVGVGDVTGGTTPSAYQEAWLRSLSRASWKVQYSSKSPLARSARSFRT